MIFRIFPTKDTFISNFISSATGLPSTGSNVGASEILEVFKTGPSGSVAPHLSSSFARALLQFDIGQFGSLTGSAGASYKLVLFNAPHGDFLPYSYDIQAHMLSQSWDEGRGLDHESFSDLGFANWTKPKQGTFWSSPGGDVLAPNISFHLDDGHEDVRMDVSSFVSAWIAGTTNSGIMVRISSSLEADANDYFVKKFHGRTTNLLDRRPYLELSFDDSAFTGSAAQAISGTAQYVVNVTNLKNSYELIENPQLRLFVRTVDYNPAVINTGSLVLPNLVVAKAYYRIDNERTTEQVIPFGTGSYQGGTDSTRLSYDGDGNYFNFSMSNLSPGNVYRIVFLFDISGQRQIVDGGFKFKVV
jgi:hypothetical protein